MQAITSCAVGFACNNLLPFRLGDGIRAAFTNIYLKIAIPDVILFMIIEKILDLSFLIILLILVFFLSPIFIEINSFIPLIFLFFVALSLAVLTFFCLANRDNRVSQYFLQITRKLQKKYFSNFWGRISIYKKTYKVNSIERYHLVAHNINSLPVFPKLC